MFEGLAKLLTLAAKAEGMSYPLRQIKRSRLLKADGNETPLDNILQLTKFSKMAHERGLLDNNLRFLNDELIHSVYRRYGGHGLTNLLVLAMGHEKWELDHFVDSLRASLALQEAVKETVPLELDNKALPADPKLLKFNTTYLQTTVARPLYAAGRKPGYLVYGVSGPRILVSHPFQGISGDVYNMYENASDLVAALTFRGYHGRFLFHDFVPGLEDEIEGIPRWAIWFSIIAQHSDIVVFVKRFERDFGPAQLLESRVIPDWVPKRIEIIPITEIQNAETPSISPDTHRMYATPEGIVTKERWNEIQREHSHPFINMWTKHSFPRDRFIHMKESGEIDEYPLDFELFA